jgi:integrase
VIPNTSSFQTLQLAASATLTITNQKNGIKGQHIHHFALTQQYCPIKTLARRVHHILSNGGTPQDLLCTYFPTQQQKRYITSSCINKHIKQTAKALGLFRPNAGYTPSDVSSHSLRAGGAMAMYLNGVPETTIMKQGRWRSSTFMHYIHEQLSGHSQGLALKMSQYIPFHNMAGPSIMLQS